MEVQSCLMSRNPQLVEGHCLTGYSGNKADHTRFLLRVRGGVCALDCCKESVAATQPKDTKSLGAGTGVATCHQRRLQLRLGSSLMATHADEKAISEFLGKTIWSLWGLLPGDLSGELHVRPARWRPPGPQGTRGALPDRVLRQQGRPHSLLAPCPGRRVRLRLLQRICCCNPTKRYQKLRHKNSSGAMSPKPPTTLTRLERDGRFENVEVRRKYRKPCAAKQSFHTARSSQLLNQIVSKVRQNNVMQFWESFPNSWAEFLTPCVPDVPNAVRCGDRGMDRALEREKIIATKIRSFSLGPNQKLRGRSWNGATPLEGSMPSIRLEPDGNSCSKAQPNQKITKAEAEELERRRIARGNYAFDD